MMAAMTARSKSFGFVVLQLAAIAYLLLTGPLLARWLPGMILQVLSLGLVLWALWALGWRQLRIGPAPAAGVHLVTRGPYRWIRHPMYLAVLMVTLPMVVQAWTPWRLAAWIALVIVLRWKAVYEETLLRERFPEYADYQRRTKRLIPFLD